MIQDVYVHCINLEVGREEGGEKRGEGRERGGEGRGGRGEER